MNKYLIAKVLASVPYYVAICHDTGKIVSQADDLTLLHAYMETIGWTWEQQ